MINFLFLICGSLLMLFNLLYIIYKFHTWPALEELRAKYPQLKKMGFLYLFLLISFFAGYITITVLWSANGYSQSRDAGIIAQILFWGAVFVKISNDNLFLLFQSFERDSKYQISNLTMSLDAYINSIPGGVHHCIMDPELSVAYISDGFTNITGYTMDDINSLFHGKYVEICYDSSDKNVFASATKNILANASSTTIIYKIRHKDGHSIWVSENMKAVKDSFDVTHIFAVLTDITLEKNQADIDGLTGLLNKRTFCTLVRDYLSSHPDETVGLFMIDLDNFKTINDTAGHPVGDIVLTETAKFLCGAFSERDCLIGRVGGDEFMVLVKDAVSQEELYELRKTVYQNFKILLPDMTQTTPLSGSIGYVFSRCSENFEDIYHKADQAMYLEKAKRHIC